VKLITVRDLYLLGIVALIQANWCFSFRLRSLLVKSLAFIVYRSSGTKRRLSEKNLSEAFGGQMCEDSVRAIIKSSFCQIWHETFSIPSPSVPEFALKGVDIRGLEHLQIAMNKGKGAILWESSFFGRRLLAKQILRQHGFAVDQVHGENHLGGFGHDRGSASRTQHLVWRFFENCERPFVREILYFKGRSSPAFIKVLRERLKQNGIICISADAQRGHKFIAVSMLGRTDFFPTATVSLAKLTGAPILPLFCIQESGDTVRLIIESPIPIEANGDRERCQEQTLIRYVSLLESYIKKYPEQYRNWNFSKGDRASAQSNAASVR
jgi:lauroyl/myristoyl acyltransferase